MPDSRAGYANGVPNGRPPAHRPPSSQHGQPQLPPPPQDPFSRPFTIQEALPYTPFTSILPINSGTAPQPLAHASPRLPVSPSPRLPVSPSPRPGLRADDTMTDI